MLTVAGERLRDEIYRVTLRENPPLLFFAALAPVLIFIGGTHRASLSLAVFGCSLVAAITVVRLRFRVAVSETGLEVRDAFRTRSIGWNEIKLVYRKIDENYWASRWYGPSVYEFVGPRCSFRVNFKLFPLECFGDVFGRIPIKVGLEKLEAESPPN